MPDKDIPLLIGSSPHIVSPVNARRLMGNMLIALMPVTIFGVVLYGLPALLTIAVSVIAAEAAEACFRKVTKQDMRVKDLSAVITGILLALVVPPSTPLWMTALGSIFAIVVAKEFFGGLGANVFNPALAGRGFLLMSFPAAMTTWHVPADKFAATVDALSAASPPDGITGATPLAILKHGAMADLEKTLFTWHLAPGGGYWDTVRTLFIGNRSGCIGESSILLILAAFIFLLITQTIDWRAPVSMIAAAFAASFVLGMDPLVAVLSGGLVFGAVYMTTDYVTSPLTAKGKIIFGAGAGLITVLIRKWGGYPEGVMYSILIMNAVVPFLNRLLPKKYGFVPKPKAAAAKEAGK